MRTEFNKLVKVMQKYDLYNSTDEVGIALKSLFDKIIEVENRLTCVIETNKDTRQILKAFSYGIVDKGLDEVPIYSDQFEILQRSCNDIDIALNMNDTECIDNNWYKLFEEPKRNIHTEKPPIKNDWDRLFSDRNVSRETIILIPKGSILEWKEKINYYSANSGAKVRVIEDYIENKAYINVEWIDELSNGQENGNYDISNFKEEFELPTIPTSLCNIPQTYEFVKDIIAKLKVIGVDGETMQYILEQVGMDEQMHRQLVMKNDYKETKDLLREKFEMEL